MTPLYFTAAGFPSQFFSADFFHDQKVPYEGVEPEVHPLRISLVLPVAEQGRGVTQGNSSLWWMYFEGEGHLVLQRADGFRDYRNETPDPVHKVEGLSASEPEGKGDHVKKTHVVRYAEWILRGKGMSVMEMEMDVLPQGRKTSD